MFRTITRSQALQVVTLEQAKSQLNIIDFDDDDAFINMCIDTAGQMVEAGTNRLLSRCDVEIVATGDSVTVDLPFGEVKGIETVTHNGEDIPYTFDKHRQQIRLSGLGLREDDDIVITFQAGYDSAAIPSPLKSAALLIISNLYDHREDAIESNLATAPMTSQTLMSGYKINRWL